MVEVIGERRLCHAVVAVTRVELSVGGESGQEVEGSGVDY